MAAAPAAAALDSLDRILVEHYPDAGIWRAYVDATGAPEATAPTRDGAMAELLRLLVTWWSCAVIEEPDRDTREALTAERAGLVARLAEVDAELAAQGEG